MPDYKLLITDGLDESGQSILRASAEVDDKNGISAEDLVNVIGDYDGLIVRGLTRVTSAVLEVPAEGNRPGRCGRGQH